MLRVHLTEQADYLVSCILTSTYQTLGHVQVHLECIHITPEAVINEFRLVPYLDLNLHGYDIIDKYDNVIESSCPARVPRP